MSTDFPIPDSALAQHTAVLGKTGAGKTSTEKLIIEHVAETSRVCILDPIKSDHWGLTSSADGTRPGLPFQILGGPHGHVPLHDGAGAAIGELVAAGTLPLSIIDMAMFGPGGHARFFSEFAETLFQRMTGVLYLVIEEAHIFAPKERSGMGSENIAIHWAKMLATGGRSKGIRLVLATQRTQSLHNALLGSCETMIVHRLTAPADQKPVIDWLKANVDTATKDRVAASLSSLRTGQAWVCSGEARLFELIQFPRIATFDNSATPTGDLGAARKVTMAAIDVARLRATVGDAVAEAEANDPVKLRKRIGELETAARQAKAATATTVSADVETVAAAEERGWIAGDESGFARGLAAAKGMAAETVRAAMPHLRNFLVEVAGGGGLVEGILHEDTPKQPPVFVPASAMAPRPPPAQPPKPRVVVGGEVKLSGPQTELLRALAWWRAHGITSPSRAQLGALAKWAPKGSNMRNRLSELSRAGMLTYSATGPVELTAAGIAAAPEPNLAGTMIASISAVLTGPQRALFDWLLAQTQHVRMTTRAALGQALGWEATGSNMRNRLSELHALELINYDRHGDVSLQDWVREGFKMRKAG